MDECHHLLEIWGRLLKAVIAGLTEPFVIGLTATPPSMMTADQKALHTELCGTVSALLEGVMDEGGRRRAAGA